MKIRKLRLFTFLITPFLIVYLAFVFVKFDFNPGNWNNRSDFVLSLITFLFFYFTVIIPVAGINNISFKDIFMYNKLEEILKRNKEIRELNRLSREQLALLKENDGYKQQAKEFVGKNKIF